MEHQHSILIMDLNPDSCPAENCEQLATVIRDNLAVEDCQIQTTKSFTFADVSGSPNLVLLRASPAIGGSPVLQILREKFEHVSILGLFCAQRETPTEVLKSPLTDIDDFIFCPFKKIDLLPRIQRLLHRTADSPILPKPTSKTTLLRFGTLVGTDQSFVRALEKVPLLAHTDATVLISGETGTGKDIFARTIHYHSPRRGKPFIPVNCGALPDHLCENELFGHSRGAFTDASSSEKGLVAEAEGGTLFLDEVDALSPSAQTKLLRFLQDKEYRPLGSSKEVIANVRVIASTNANLWKLVEVKQFREDLYYRLNVLSLSIPPLRDRIEDIPLLAEHFLTRYAGQHHRGSVQLSAGALQKLIAYPWPGNVRELDGLLHRAVILCRSSILQPEDIDLPGEDQSEEMVTSSLRQAKARTIGHFERTYLINLLRSHQGNVSRAAKAAGKERRTFQRLLQKYGLQRQDFRDPT